MNHERDETKHPRWCPVCHGAGVEAAAAAVGGDEARAIVFEDYYAALFMVHEMNRQLGGVDDALVRYDLKGAQALVRHLIYRSGLLLDNAKADVTRARKGAR